MFQCMVLCSTGAMFLEPITPPLIHILGVFSHLLIHITSETDRTQKIDGCLLACPLKKIILKNVPSFIGHTPKPPPLTRPKLWLRYFFIFYCYLLEVEIIYVLVLTTLKKKTTIKLQAFFGWGPIYNAKFFQSKPIFFSLLFSVLVP